ncbi:hypothetical protein FH609_005380 [Streptomyces sp. 3MP-14]|uniref:Uncharacterized protein n=1 Tax=Streptomyces mimosae TaxID=2586635 RepID=A0A5N6APV6_9ACTN|nr:MULTISPECIES: hypothetical protein [Streptomyces]KAB8169729.1 hypothetical protein FH607_003060 [Streptomyces mimosae]KAB8178477.1 hypothetical protein FH609_005380 [Streptomyces sp. 3MP-14]
MPHSVELASTDDSGPAGLALLTVVSARLPASAMGQEAVRRLHRRIEGAADPLDHVVLPATVSAPTARRNTLRFVPTDG